MKATVFVYSGRRNPIWGIDEKEYDELLLFISTLPEVGDAIDESALGYSGFEIKSGNERIHAFNGTISIKDEAGIKHFADKGRIAEKRILNSAPFVIQQEIKNLLPHELR